MKNNISDGFLSSHVLFHILVGIWVLVMNRFDHTYYGCINLYVWTALCCGTVSEKCARNCYINNRLIILHERAWQEDVCWEMFTSRAVDTTKPIQALIIKINHMRTIQSMHCLHAISKTMILRPRHFRFSQPITSSPLLQTVWTPPCCKHYSSFKCHIS